MRAKTRSDLLVDGYNVINCWPKLLQQSENLEHARDRLIHILLEYGAFERYDVTVVFDALYTSSKQSYEKLNRHFSIVYTQKGKTADSYIERLSYEAVHAGKEVFVVTSDGAEQNAILGVGAYRITVKELSQAVKRAKQKSHNMYNNGKSVFLLRNELADRIDANVLRKMEELRRKHDNN